MLIPIPNVRSGHILSGAVTGHDFGGSFVIASGTVGTNDIGSGQITSGLFGSGQISRFAMASGAINSGHIANAAATSGNYASGSLFNDFMNPLLFTEVAISGTSGVSINYGQAYVCGGISGSNYAVTLPTPASGRSLNVRVDTLSSGLLVYLTGSSGTTIDGSGIRPMWAGESAWLYCNGSGHYKIGGKSIPLSATYSASGNAVSTPSGVITFIPMAGFVSDNIGIMGNVFSGSIQAVRAGNYTVDGIVDIKAQPAIIVQVSTVITKNSYVGGVGQIAHTFFPSVAANINVPSVSVYRNGLQLASGDFVAFFVNNGSSGTAASGNNPISNRLSLVEIPSW